MCGIIGYVGGKAAAPILLEGLRRLEYRGYDSAGLAILKEADLLVRKRKGKIDEGLAPLLEREPAPGALGIGHTRWATHGPPPTRIPIRTAMLPVGSPWSTTG
jgi:glutamine---fructose-6-phosphate transaminase (isomerizing)